MSVETGAPAKKKAAKRTAKKVAGRPKGAEKVAVERAPAVGKKTAKKAGKKKAAKKKVSARARVKTVAEPKAKSVAKPKAKKTVVRKASAKQTASPDVSSGAPVERRRGRPVSVDLLRRKLEKAQKLARSEKERRRAVAGKARKAIAAHVARNKQMRTELAATKRELGRLDTEVKAAERAREQEQQIEMARETAVQTFLEGWEKDFLKKEATGKRRRGRPRRRKSKS